ncbi:MAG: PaaI family thioesterase [Rhodospirillales bacterium]
MTEKPRLTIAEFEALWQGEETLYHLFGMAVEEIGHGHARLRMAATPKLLRPGGTISGPAQMALADCAAYAALLGAIGPVALAVTTNLTINFLNKPRPADLICDCRVIKLGRRLAVIEAANRSDGEADPVSHVVATYSIPPDHLY